MVRILQVTLLDPIYHWQRFMWLYCLLVIHGLGNHHLLKVHLPEIFCHLHLLFLTGSQQVDPQHFPMISIHNFELQFRACDRFWVYLVHGEWHIYHT